MHACNYIHHLLSFFYPWKPTLDSMSLFLSYSNILHQPSLQDSKMSPSWQMLAYAGLESLYWYLLALVLLWEASWYRQADEDSQPRLALQFSGHGLATVILVVLWSRICKTWPDQSWQFMRSCCILGPLRISFAPCLAWQERRLKHEPMLHGVTADRECFGKASVIFFCMIYFYSCVLASPSVFFVLEKPSDAEDCKAKSTKFGFHAWWQAVSISWRWQGCRIRGWYL